MSSGSSRKRTTERLNSQLVVMRTDADGNPVNPFNASPSLQAVASFLVDKKNVRFREGVFHGKRMEYFKGKRVVDALLSSRYLEIQKKSPKKFPKINDREHASNIVRDLMEGCNFFFRVDKQGGSTSGVSSSKTLEISSKQFFEEQAYYIWQWTSPTQRIKQVLISVGLVVAILTVVLFPLWPMKMRLGVWYLSMGGLGLLGSLFALAIIRLILYLLSLVTPFTRPGIWLFPNLFADVGVVDSFIPLWGWHGVDYESAHLEKYKRQAKLASSSGSSKKKSSKKKKKDVKLSHADSPAQRTDDNIGTSETESSPSKPLIKKRNVESVRSGADGITDGGGTSTDNN